MSRCTRISILLLRLNACQIVLQQYPLSSGHSRDLGWTSAADAVEDRLRRRDAERLPGRARDLYPRERPSSGDFRFRADCVCFTPDSVAKLDATGLCDVSFY